MSITTNAINKSDGQIFNGDDIAKIDNNFKTLQDAINNLPSGGGALTPDQEAQLNKIGDLSGNGLTETNLANAIKNDRSQLSDIPNQTYITEKAKTVDVNNALALKANTVDLNTQKSRIDLLVQTANASYYEKTTSGTTGALLVVASGATTGQINLASVTPVSTGYTATAGDYVRLVYGVASGSAELIDARTGADGKIYNSAGTAVRTQISNINNLFPKAANIFDQTKASVGYYYSQTEATPTLVANANYTAYLFDVEPNTTYTVTGSSFFRSEFDASGTRLCSVDNTENSPYTFTTLATTAKVAISFRQLNYPISTYMIVKGNTLPPIYVKYGYNLSDDVIFNIVPDDTTFLTKTANIFDQTKASVGYYYSTTGTKDTALTASANYIAYLLKTEKNTTYTITGTSFQYIFYRADGTKIAGFGDYSDDSPVTFTTDGYTAYVGISWKQSIFPIENYMIVKGSSLPFTYVKYGYNLSDDIQINAKNNILTVRKDGKGNFTKVYDAVLYANQRASKDNEYDIYIYDTSVDFKGTSFDILVEMGGDAYLATITDISNQQKGLPLTGYVNLHGVGKVKLYAHLASTVTLAQSTCFSVVDAIDEFYCENLIFEIQNGRYAFHDESANLHPFKNHKFNKCKFIHLGNAAGLWAPTHAYAAGTSAGCIYEYRDCVFDASASGMLPWDLHNYAPQEGSIISLDGCEMIKASSQVTSIKLGFNGSSYVTNDSLAYDACYNDVFIKNIIADGKIRVAPETTAYSCTNNFRLHNFTNLTEDIEPDYIKS